MQRLPISTSLILALISGTVTLADDPPKPAVKVEDPLKPLPLIGIPDDPPPHEGAMIDIPVTIEPPDIITVEVLEALPGRPITGEHLVRPDGTISLGFYGDVHVRGLTTRQAKVKILLHLREYIADHVLGLVLPFGGEAAFEAVPGMQPEPPPPAGNPFDSRPKMTNPPGLLPEIVPPVEKKPEVEAKPKNRTMSSISRRNGLRRDRVRAARRARTLSSHAIDQPQAEQDPKPPPPAAQPKEQVRPPVPIVEGPLAEHFRKLPLQVPENWGEYRVVEPADSLRVFVEITSYNSKVYFVQGDVGVPGRYPFTGKETVLDALNYAGGFVAIAEPKDIHLYRSAQGGKPAKDYTIDHEAILKGVKTANLQMFPNDRLVIGRNPIVKKTVEIDRANALLNSILNTTLQYGFTARTLASINPPPSGGNGNVQVRVNGQNMPINLADPAALTPAQRDAMLKEWAEFLWSLSSKEGGAMLDEKVFREILMKKLTPTPAPEAK